MQCLGYAPKGIALVLLWAPSLRVCYEKGYVMYVVWPDTSAVGYGAGHARLLGGHQASCFSVLLPG